MIRVWALCCVFALAMLLPAAGCQQSTPPPNPKADLKDKSPLQQIAPGESAPGPKGRTIKGPVANPA